jgi:hypothetical protein
METIRVTYQYDDYGNGSWMADSADLTLLDGSKLVAGGASYAEAREQVCGVLPWSLERDDLEIVHFIDEASIPAYIAERERAAA